MKIIFLALGLLLFLTEAGCGENLPDVVIDMEPENVAEPVVLPIDTNYFSTAYLDEVSPYLDFGVNILAGWKVEYIPEIEALNFYDPTVPAESFLDQSQIFVRTFNASTFLTLSTVEIYSAEEFTIQGRPAVRYDIEKKDGVANFSHQPSWRNVRHFVTDIRSTDDPSTTFYVFAQRPDLPNETFDAFLNSVIFNPSMLYFPMVPFEEQITLKPFGFFVTPETSPVQPERFYGFHTGVDVETTEIQQEEAVWVYSMAAGTIRLVDEVDGYGGVVVIEHTLEDTPYLAVYGHLDLSSVDWVEGDLIFAGGEVGVLGDAYSTETDGERKHLHFALLKGTEIDLRGYVETEAELVGWIDPLVFFTEHGADSPRGE